MLKNFMMCAAGGAFFFITGTATARPVVQKLDFVERATSDTVSLHGGAATDNVGDMLTFVNEVFDAANSTKLGHSQGFCVRLVVGKFMECHWTLVLAEGQIMTDGPVYDDRDSDLAVTGGTGAWTGMGGEVTIHARDAKVTAYDFHYRLR